jgi:hypothetical protein
MVMQPGGHSSLGHETRDVAPRPIALASLVVLGVALAFMGAMWLLIDLSAERQARLSPPANPLAATFARKEPPEPRLQTQPLRDLEDLRERERALLEGYDWVDRGAGVVRIPIDRAKQLIAERGLPATGGQP